MLTSINNGRKIVRYYSWHTTHVSIIVFKFESLRNFLFSFFNLFTNCVSIKTIGIQVLYFIYICYLKGKKKKMINLVVG